MNFDLKICFDTVSTISVRWRGRAYYTETYYDNIDISDGAIIISGHRSSAFDLKKVLFNTTSTLYYQIAKSLSFYYLCSGFPLTIQKMELSSDVAPLEIETDFLQPFRKRLNGNQVIAANQLESLFLFQNKEQLFLVSNIYYINAIQDNTFDYYWKSFNSLYNILEPSGKDFNKLCAVRNFIENHRIEFKNTLSHISHDTAKDIRKLRIREFILNNWPTFNHTKAYSDTIRRFTDVRIIDVFDETLPYRMDYLKTLGLDADVISHIANCKSNNKTDDVELLCFYILKYSYFIRNKYFHAEKANPFFILKQTSELDEMHKISEIFKLFLADFIRCNSLYL